MLFELTILFFAYFIGSVPSGYLISRARGINDIRLHGSGNIGATNVARTLGYKYFFIVFFADCAKAYACLRLIAWFNVNEQLLIASAAALLLGNGASLFLKFRGGKGIATTVGILLALFPMVLPYLFFIWLLIVMITKTVGIASVAALVSLPLVVMFLADSTCSFMMLMLSIAALGIFWHRENIIGFVKLYSFSGDGANK